jgi:hypothetical protein
MQYTASQAAILAQTLDINSRLEALSKNPTSKSRPVLYNRVQSILKGKR